MNFLKTTEQSSLYQNLENMSISELLTHINNEDKKVASAVEKAVPQIDLLVTQIVLKLKQGGRLFYMGAGTNMKSADDDNFHKFTLQEVVF